MKQRDKAKSYKMFETVLEERRGETMPKPTWDDSAKKFILDGKELNVGDVVMKQGRRASIGWGNPDGTYPMDAENPDAWWSDDDYKYPLKNSDIMWMPEF
jgi:hypothetical protein